MSSTGSAAGPTAAAISHDVVAPRAAQDVTATYKATRAKVRIGTSERGLEIKVDGDRVPKFRGTC